MLTITKRQLSKSLRTLVVALVLLLVFVSPSFAATVELVAVNEPHKPGVFPLFVYVDSDGLPTVGTDLMITYDPTRVSFHEIKFQGVYPQEHDVNHDVTNHTIRFSGSNDFESYAPIEDIMAVVYFESFEKMKKGTKFLEGDTSPIKLVWSKDATDDTNVVSVDGKDLVESQPAGIRIDPEYKKEKVKGIFSETQQALLADTGIISEATVVDNEMSLSTVIGMVLIAGSLIVLFLFFFLKRRKKDEEENDGSDKVTSP